MPSATCTCLPPLLDLKHTLVSQLVCWQAMAKILCFVLLFCNFLGGQWLGKPYKTCPSSVLWLAFGCWTWARTHKGKSQRSGKLAPYREEHPIAPWDIIIHPCNRGLACSLAGSSHQSLWERQLHQNWLSSDSMNINVTPHCKIS